MAELSVVGKSVIRIDALEKVTGAAKYVSDFMVGAPGMLEAKVLTSPYPHARILKVDISKAQRAPGVKVVVTAKDAPRNNQGMVIRDQPLLARDTVRFIGDPVAAVAAETVEAAEEALSLIKVEYEELPAVFDPEEAMKPDTPVIVHPDFEQYKRTGGERGMALGSVSGLGIPNVCAHYKIRKGDIEGGFKEADLIVENRFTAPRVTHGNLETDYCIAQKGSDGSLTMWNLQRPVHRTKSMLCKLFDLPPSKVRVIAPYVGGSFGRHAVIEQICALLALRTDRPVRLILSREEVFSITHSRVPTITYLKDGVKKDGSLVARELKLVCNAGAYSGYMPRGVLSFSQGAVATYRIPNFRLDSYGVYTNELPMHTWRGVGAPQLHWAMESQMDIIAEKLGIDPVELRKRNILNEGEKNVIGETTHSIGVRECLDKVAESIEWGKPSEKDAGPWRRGKGIAAGGRYGQGGAADCVHIKVHEDGTIELRHGSDEVGQGANTVLAQIAAEEFGISIDRVKVVRGDTAIVPFAGGASSSRTTFYSGNATILACQDAKRQIFELAASVLKVFPHELEIADGKVFVKELPQRAIRISDLFLPGPLDKGGEIIGKGTYYHRITPMDPETGQVEKMQGFYMYGAQAIEVAVNVLTGQIKVLRVSSAYDVGQPINPKLCEGQIEGGLAMGIGPALGEELLMDKGRVLNPNFRDYKMLTATQIPSGQNVKSMLVKAPHRDGPYGAKGLGEVTVMPTAPAIGNAIYNAIGIRIYDLPMTLEKILKCLKGKEGPTHSGSAPVKPRVHKKMYFEYFEPLTVEEVVSLLSKYGDRAKALAGGTDLVVRMKERTLMPQYVVNIGRIADLNYIRFNDDRGLRVGTLTTIREMEQSRLLQPRYSIISQAAGQLADIAVRNVATVGGNLCNAAPSADMAPALVALSAAIKLVSTTGERVVPLENFFTGPGTTVLKPDELLVEIQVPTPPAHTAGVYLKHSIRGVADLAIVGVAVVLTLDSGNGVCTDAKVVLGAVAPTPMRARKAEAILKGKKLDRELIEKAAQTASDESSPIDDVRSSAEYRREIVKVLAGDAIRQATELTKSAK